MQISIIIATYNRRDLLARTLPPLLAQDFPAGAYEVVVVVDGSTDGTAEFLRSLPHRGNLRIIEQPNKGQAAAINTGIRESRGELLLFLDDDILCPPNLVAEHAHAPRAEKACLAFGPVLVSPEGRDPLALAWARTFCDDFFQKTVHDASEKGWYGCMASANSSLPRSLALSIGGLDDTFSRGNDVEFGYRLLKAGYQFVYVPGAGTHQIFNKSRRDVIDDASGEGSAEVRLSRKFPELRTTSRLASLSSKPLWKRSVARFAATTPLPLVSLLTPITWLAEKMSLRRVALRLLQTQQNIAAYRSAVREAGSWQALQGEFAVRLPVLMYHSIGPLRNGFDEFLTIPTHMFEEHLRWLQRNGYTSIHLSEWTAWLRDGKPLPRKPVVLTFDDGYRDTAEFGFPLLKKYGFKGTLFIPTDYIGRTNRWDLPLGVSEQPLMTADEIRSWSNNGIEIGSHSISHPDLRACPDDIISAELKESRETLQQLLGTPVTSFAYPYGYLDVRARDTAARTYDAALTCDIGLNTLSTDPLLLRRATIVPRFTFGQMFWATHLGCNLLLVLKIQASLFFKRLFKRQNPST